jgi:hypothetical protein
VKLLAVCVGVVGASRVRCGGHSFSFSQSFSIFIEKGEALFIFKQKSGRSSSLLLLVDCSMPSQSLDPELSSAGGSQALCLSLE